MKPFSNNKISKNILFLELILIFSMVSSFIILNFIKEKKINSNRRNSGYKDLYKNYEILKYFQDLENDIFFNEKVPETLALNVNNSFIADILKLRSVKSFLENKKLQKAYNLLYSLDNRYDFVARKKHKLYLRYLYFQRRYGDFIKQYYLRIVNDFELELFLIDCLDKTKKRTEAFSIFKNLFKRKRIHSFQKILSPYTLQNFLKKLDYQFWFEKFKFLVKKNDYREFLIEKKYVNMPQLLSLFSAEFNYLRGRYKQSQRFLRRVKAEQFLNDRERLAVKIDLRLNNFTDINKRIEGLKNDKSLYADLLYNAASILLIEKKLDLSLNFFLKYIRLIEVNSFKNFFIIKDPKYWKSLWLSAWIYFRKNDKKSATYYFKRGTLSPLAPYRIANLYWLYKLENIDPKRIESYPFSYYYTKVVKTNIQDIGLKRFIDLINHKQSQYFVEIIDDLKSLIKYHLIDECFDFIDWAKGEKRLTQSDKNMLNIIKSILHLKQQDFYRSFSSFKIHFKNYLVFRLPRFLRELYSPVKYNVWIDFYSKMNRVDKLLIYALIRDESFFRADVVSPSGACGLMQLMLQTANKVGNKHGVKIRRRDLFKPEINIRLGIAYFKYLNDKYNGKLHLAIAAYNAGDHRVDRWINEFGNVSDDEFIEMIPFSETRNYVKNVFRNYYYYKFYYK